MIFFLGVFFSSIRPTDPIPGNAFNAKRKKKGSGDGLISDIDTAKLYVQVPVPGKKNKLSFHWRQIHDQISYSWDN